LSRLIEKNPARIGISDVSPLAADLRQVLTSWRKRHSVVKVALQNVTSSRDLGVLLTRDLFPSAHATY